MKSSPEISVCIFTLNPDPNLFRRVIKGLKEQMFTLSRYEIIIVDNGSIPSIAETYCQDLAWHPSVKFCVEPERGYAYTNRRLFDEARADVIVILGDDCILNSDYLEKAISVFSKHPDVGVLTGSVKFESIGKVKKLVKSLHDQVYFGGIFSGYEETRVKTKFTVAMRGSAGMAIRKEVGYAFLQRFWIYPEIMAALKRSNLPFNLFYEDLDIAMHALHLNYKIARSGELQLTHLTLNNKMKIVSFVKRAYLEGFFLEIFFMRWNWYPYNQNSIREWGRLLRPFFHPVFPVSRWITRLSQLCGGIQARWFVINHQSLLYKVGFKQK